MLTLITQYIKSDQKSVKSMLWLTIVSGLITIMIPFVVQVLIQQYTLLVFQPSTVALVVLITLFFTAITLMRCLQIYMSEYFQRRLFLKAVEQTRLFSLKAKKENKVIKPKEWNYVFESISLQKSLIPLIFDGITFVLQAALVLIVVSFYHPFFIAYSLLLAIAFYTVVVKWGQKTMVYNYEESNKKHELLEKLETLEIKETNEDLDPYILGYFEARDLKYREYFKQSLGLFIIKIVAAVSLLIIGGLLVFQQNMTIGQLIASELIITNLLISLFKFSNLLDYYYDTTAAIKKLNLLKANIEQGTHNEG